MKKPTTKEKLIAFKRSVKRGFKTIRRKGILSKIIIIVSALALIATSVLPFII